MIRGFRAVLIISFLFLAFTIQAQEQTIVQGRVSGAASQEIGLVYNKVPIVNKPLELRVKTDSLGNFFVKFPLDRKATIDFVHGTNTISLILAPGDSVNINAFVEAGIYDYILSGKGYQESYLNYLNLKNFDREVVKTFHEQVKSLDPVAYDKKVKEWMKDFDKVLKDNLKSIDADKSLRKHAERMMLIKEANYYLIYANYQKSLGQKEFVLPAVFSKVLSNKELFTIDYTPSSEYQNFLILHISTLGPKPNDNVCLGVIGFLEFIDSVYAKKSHDELMARILWEAMDNGCYKQTKTWFDAYVATSVYPDYVQTLQGRASQLASLEVGDMAPDFKFVDINGKPHSFSELRGKVIYLDFWATWCGPCIQSMKLSAPLKEKFKDNPDVAFVYISTDQNAEKWKGHTITNNGEANMWHMGESSYAASVAYQIQTIPRYVIIDKEGKIVDANAPRPYSPEIEVILLREASKPFKKP